MASKVVSKFKPLFDRVLVQRLAAESKTKGGIVLPEKPSNKVLEGKVVAVGPGARTEDGKTLPLSVKPGDFVLLPEYGGSKIQIGEEEYTLLRDGDILGVFEK